MRYLSSHLLVHRNNLWTYLNPPTQREKSKLRLKEVPKAKFQDSFDTTRNLMQSIADRLTENDSHSKIASALLDYMRTAKRKSDESLITSIKSEIAQPFNQR